nr:MAG TPA: hypothetical protein [Caudoviricetes sp.]
MPGGVVSRFDSGGVDLLTDGHILGLHRVIWRHIAVTRRAAAVNNRG